MLENGICSLTDIYFQKVFQKFPFMVERRKFELFFQKYVQIFMTKQLIPISVNRHGF